MDTLEFLKLYKPTLLEPDKEVERLLVQWKQWRNSNDFRELMYPCDAGYSPRGLPPMGSGRKPLPAWNEQLLIECVVEKELKVAEPLYYDCIYAFYNISTISNPKPYGDMTMRERAKKLKISRDMFYAKVNLAKSWIRGRLGI